MEVSFVTLKISSFWIFQKPSAKERQTAYERSLPSSRWGIPPPFIGPLGLIPQSPLPDVGFYFSTRESMALIQVE